MDAGFEKFKRKIYIHALAIILEKLQMSYEFTDDGELEFDLHIIRDQHINTTGQSIEDIDNIINLILTR